MSFAIEKHRVEGVKINSIHYLAKIENVPRGHSHYTLVISQYEQNNTIDYTLGVRGCGESEEMCAMHCALLGLLSLDLTSTQNGMNLV